MTFSKKKSTADVIFLSQVQYKNNYLFKMKIKGIIKTFIIPNQLSSYKENILASLSIIINFFETKKIKKKLIFRFLYT